MHENIGGGGNCPVCPPGCGPGQCQGVLCKSVHLVFLVHHEGGGNPQPSKLQQLLWVPHIVRADSFMGGFGVLLAI